MVLKILITGKSGYISSNIESWLGRTPELFVSEKISLRNENWKDRNWSEFDVIIHTSGIAHIRSNNRNKDDYYRINHELAVEVATKAKNDGIKQFIFFSSINVYGTRNFASPIVEETIPQPNTHYGKSKLLAEQDITKLRDESFRVAVLRPPMIYGDNAKGNYVRLVKFAQKLPIFPDFENSRSMLYIDSLCEFVRLLILNQDEGLFFPQNSEYVCTSELVREIAKKNQHVIIFTKAFNPLISVMRYFFPLVRKVFGNLAYDLEMSQYSQDYRVCGFEESINGSISVCEGKLI